MFCMAQGSYSRVSAPVHVGQVIRETCREIDMSLKEAALVMDLDAATLSRGLNGDGPLDLWHFVLLPMRWHRVFLMKLSSALIVSWFDERVAETSNERRRA